MPASVSQEPSTADEVQPRQAGGYGWVIGLWVVVVLFAAVTAFRSYQVGIPFRDPSGSIFVHRIFFTIGLGLLYSLIDAAVRTGWQGWTLRRAGRTLRARWPRERLALAAIGLLAYHVVYACYHNLKSWNAFRPIRDSTLLRVDHAMFFGHSPAVLLHDALGQHYAAYILAEIYESFGYLVPSTFVMAVVFTRQIRDGYVFLAAAIWTWILGTASYYLIPTIGPFHAAPQEFAGLTHTIVTTTQASYVSERLQLLQHPGASDSFSSIAAFASLHCGYTGMVMLMLFYYGQRKLAIVAAVYLVAVMISTVYLGWHFAIDDLAGLVIAALSVFLGRLMIYPRGRSAVIER